MTAGLNIFALVLVAISLVTIVPAETSRAVRASEGEPVTDDVIIEATRKPERDIYFLNFDRYGSDWSLKQAYGDRATTSIRTSRPWASRSFPARGPTTTPATSAWPPR